MPSGPVAFYLFVCATAILAFSSSASAQTSEWTLCASEGGVCSFSGTQEVRYGANGSYFYRTLTDGTACTNSVFGDPAVGTVKSCALQATEWTFCASEGGVCAFIGTKQVRYGANGSFFYGIVTDGTPCTNSVFGDPAFGIPKQCATSAVTAEWTFCVLEGGSCAFTGTREVRYGANGSFFYRILTAGTACSNSVFGDPAFGTQKHCDTRAIIGPAYGPRSTITCSAGAVNIAPGSSISQIVGMHPAGTTFCIRAGVHQLKNYIIPRTGDTFVGEYGAVLDGTLMNMTTDDTEAAFRAHDQGIDNVTIRNLVIRNFRRGIHGFGLTSDHWTIEYNEIAFNHSGVVFPSSSSVRNNYIHHNTNAGYFGAYTHNSTVDTNEIAYNGWEQKVSESANVTFRNNFVHHNQGPGIWYDGNNTAALIEGNVVEDNGHIGIWYEISATGIIRNNIVRRSADAGVFISTSRDVQIHNNTLDTNFRAITYFINCPSFGGGAIGFDLANVAAHDNTITVGTASGALASVFSYASCTSTQLASYENNSKNLTFSHNAYDVPSPTTVQYWYWNGHKFWNEWQAVGHDLDSVAQ